MLALLLYVVINQLIKIPTYLCFVSRDMKFLLVIMIMSLLSSLSILPLYFLPYLIGTGLWLLLAFSGGIYLVFLGFIMGIVWLESKILLRFVPTSSIRQTLKAAIIANTISSLISVFILLKLGGIGVL